MAGPGSLLGSKSCQRYFRGFVCVVEVVGLDLLRDGTGRQGEHIAGLQVTARGRAY